MPHLCCPNLTTDNEASVSEAAQAEFTLAHEFKRSPGHRRQNWATEAGTRNETRNPPDLYMKRSTTHKSAYCLQLPNAQNEPRNKCDINE